MKTLSHPTCLAILLCLVLGFSLLRSNPADLAPRYQALAQKSLDNKDYPTALVASLRLMGFGDQYRNDALFKLAQAKIGVGQTADASNILEMVAPIDKQVYAPAHLYVARALIASAGQSRRTEEMIVAQLRNVLALQPDSVEAKDLLARFQK